MESVSVARLEREIEMPYPALFFKHRGKQGFQFCHSEVSFFFFFFINEEYRMFFIMSCHVA